MNNKELFLSHLARYWLIYVAYAVIASLFWCYAVTLFTMDRPKEVITVWVLSYDLDQTTLVDRLEREKPDYIKHVRVNFHSRKDPYLYVAYKGEGADMDVLILPESFIYENVVVGNYLSLDTDYLDEVFENVEYYFQNDNAYGIKICDKNSDDNAIIKYFDDKTEKENYYILINKKSLHMGKLNNGALDGGIEVIRSLIENGSSV